MLILLKLYDYYIHLTWKMVRRTFVMTEPKLTHDLGALEIFNVGRICVRSTQWINTVNAWDGFTITLEERPVNDNSLHYKTAANVQVQRHCLKSLNLIPVDTAHCLFSNTDSRSWDWVIKKENREYPLHFVNVTITVHLAKGATDYVLSSDIDTNNPMRIELEFMPFEYET
jgi:hypothetical protein